MGSRRVLGSIVLVDREASLDCFAAPVSPDQPDAAVMRIAPEAVLITSLAADTICLRQQLDVAFAAFGGR